MWLTLAAVLAAGGDLQALAWMAGTWTGSDGGVQREEHWMAPRGGSMLGVHRDTQGGRTVSFEFLRIEAGADGIVYWASPQGRPATPFKLAGGGAGGATDDGSAVFENPHHDFPRRILYWRDGAGALCARTEGTLGGKPASEEWCWKAAAAQR
jgi:hypothetical protein